MSTSEYSGKFHLYRKDDWAKLPAMRWQIEELVPLHGVTLLFGQPKVGKKSFIGISQACAVATGQDWCGHKTQQGNVLYVVGEGFYGMLRRQAAWEKVHGCPVGDSLRYLRAPVNFSSADEVKAAIKALKAQGFEPGFIVIDTLARSMSGAKENAAEDMSRVFELLEAFRTALSDASILVIHHTTKDGLNYRGSSVIPAAVDGLIESKANGLDITLTSAGFKDVAELDAVTVRCVPVSVETEDGWQTVLAVKDRVADAPQIEDQDKAAIHAKSLLNLVAQHFPNGAIRADLERQSGMTASTFYRAHSYAVDKGWLSKHGNLYNLAADKPPSEIPSPSPPTSTPYRELEVMEVREGTSNGGELEVDWRLKQSKSCKNSDTTSKDKKPSQIKESKSSPPIAPLAIESGVAYDKLEAFAVALEQLSGRPSRKGSVQ